MSMQAAQVVLFAKLFWIWIGLLTSVFVFWRLRRIWLKRHPPMAVRVKYSRRLAKRLRDRQASVSNTEKNQNAAPPYAIQGGRPWGHRLLLTTD
ncbi:hypothetical protein, partial [Acidovorax sp. SD340]|uniref:hypothetical protein n=1 Tax=Acidovorax sp. SD340 TaxID=1690268 RepID=UPI000A40944B